MTLSGLVTGWGTSCEDPSSGPHSRPNFSLEVCELSLSVVLEPLIPLNFNKA